MAAAGVLPEEEKGGRAPPAPGALLQAQGAGAWGAGVWRALDQMRRAILGQGGRGSAMGCVGDEGRYPLIERIEAGAAQGGR